MVALLPEWYPELENDAWQKSKGKIAKIATAGDGTGIGDKLKKLKAEYKKVDWDMFQVGVALRDTRRSEWTDAIKDEYKRICAGEIKKIEPVRKMASSVETEARDLAAKWKTSKLIPKSSVTAAQTVSDKAKALVARMVPGNLNDVMKENIKFIDEALDKQAKQSDEFAGKGKKLADAVLTKIDGVAAQAPFDTDPKAPEYKDRFTEWKAVWGRFWSENIRGMGTVNPLLYVGRPELAKYKAAFLTITSDQTVPETKQELVKRTNDLKKMCLLIKKEVG